jgi:hypothetical protein
VARINIEEKWWTDPRRSKLGQLLGNPFFAESVAASAWRLAQEYWEKGELIPGHIFVMLFGAMELLRANLAQLREARLPQSAVIRTPLEHISTNANTTQTHFNIIEQAYVYVRGSEELLSWGREIREKRALAGRKSAAKRRLTHGTAQPISNKRRTKSNILELSGSGSGSDSSSSSDSGSNFKTNGLFQNFDWESVYSNYPKRDGSQNKAAGLKQIQIKIKTQEEFEKFQKAVSNYASHCREKGKEGTTWVAQFKTFTGELWKEWVDPPDVVRSSNGNTSTEQHILALHRFEERERSRNQQAEPPGELSDESTEQF